MLEKAVKFINNIDGKKAAVIFDNDGDGIGSAAMIAKFLKTIFKKYPEAISKTSDLYFITKEIFQRLRKFDFIITLDIAFDEKPEHILKLAKKSKILVIDHHQIHENLNKYKNIVHINPELWQTKFPSYKYCVSKIVYDIISKISNTENLEWLTGIGIVNDKCEDVWKDFLNRTCKKYKISLRELKLVNDIITSGYYYSGIKGAKIGYQACLEASSPLDILSASTPSSKKLKNFYNSIEREIVSITKNWKKNAEVFEDKKLIILELNTKFSVNSPISTKISTEKPDYTVIVARKKGKETFISLRRQDKKINCGELASSAIKNLKNAKGGGHIPAAGASIMSKDWKIFRKRILELS
jgi:single-stranded DNA-specific DHH superfamily exonuclease